MALPTIGVGLGLSHARLQYIVSAFFTSPNNNMIMGSVSPDVYGMASGAIATGRALGMSLSLATTAVVFNLFGSQRDPARTPF
ncbi:MAG: hypothetical protein A2Z43_09265 [Syntrophobacterales bacterium RBG_19FT_COMBO_59_10]|nr:MAG: hypothetical protein A2Z43_09265 [Syntrophobacterales bacterium RBG_19FT_COMBO_59_10]